MDFLSRHMSDCPPHAVNLRAGVVVAMGGQMLKSGARGQSLEVALGRQVRLCRHHTI